MSNNRYLPALLKIAKDEIPQLNYDVANASTLFTQQKCLEKQNTIITYLVHHAILNAGGTEIAKAEAPLPAPLPAPAPQVQSLPQLAGMGAPPMGHAGVSPSSVPEVVITPQGSHVIPPGGQGTVATAPPGAPVDATFGRSHQEPLAPPSSLEGNVKEVVLPRGGLPMGTPVENQAGVNITPNR